MMYNGVIDFYRRMIPRFSNILHLPSDNIQWHGSWPGGTQVARDIFQDYQEISATGLRPVPSLVSVSGFPTRH